MIPNRSILTYQGEWPCCSGLFVGPDQSFAAISTRLTAAGLPVRNHSISNVPFFSGPYSVTMQIQVENGLGFARVEDAISVIRHHVYQVEGQFPLSETIPLVQSPSGGGGSTGQPPAPRPLAPQQEQCLAGSSMNSEGKWSLSCWFGALTTKGLSTVGFLVLITVLGVALMLYAGIRVPALATSRR